MLLNKKDKSMVISSMITSKEEYENDYFFIEDEVIKNKIIENYPHFDFALDSKGILIDIIPTEKPFIPPTKEEINSRVVERIREKYSIDDEFQMHRLGLIDSNNEEYKTYISFVSDCIAWGDSEKTKYGY